MINYTLTQYWEKFEKALSILFQEYSSQNKEKDETYVNYHNSAIEMLCAGKKVESANVYNKYILGEQIKKAIKNGFVSKGVPKVGSDYTFQFAKLFMEHSQILAGGHVYSEQTLINVHLKLNRSVAENDALTIERRIKKYEASKFEAQTPKIYCNSYVKDKITKAQPSDTQDLDLSTRHSCAHKK